MTNAQLINQTSGNTEYYTPQVIIEAARITLGEIDLDPASSQIANKYIKAGKIFTEETGFPHGSWSGRVWMNHPFGRKLNHKWISKIEEEYLKGHITACCLTFACTSEKWFLPLLKRPQCYLCPRTNFILPDGSIKRGVTKGSVVTYFGKEVQNFAEAFKSLGIVKIPYVEPTHPQKNK